MFCLEKEGLGKRKRSLLFSQSFFRTFNPRPKKNFFNEIFKSLYLNKITLVLYQVDPAFVKDNQGTDVIQTFSM